MDRVEQSTDNVYQEKEDGAGNLEHHIAFYILLIRDAFVK
jgi:hypothetical protein